jgi:MFS family permease
MQPDADATPAVENPRRALVAVFAIVFVDLLGFGIIVPILPFYVRSFGVSDVFIGLLAASYSLAQLVAAPLLGRLSDDRGRRPVLLLSLAGSVVAWTVFGLASAVWVLFASRLLAGAMGGNIAAAQAYIADVTPPERRAGALGLVGAAFGLGFIFGPALGGVLASDPAIAAARTLLPAAVPATRFSVPSFGAASLSLLGLVLGAAFLPETRVRRRDAVPVAARAAQTEHSPNPTRTTPPRRLSWLADFRTALAHPRLRWLVSAFFLYSFAFSGIQVMAIPFAADALGFDASATAVMLTYIGVFGVLTQGVLVGRLSRRYTEPPVAVAGTAALAAAMAALPFAPAAGRALGAGLPGPVPPGVVAVFAVLPVLAVGNGLLSVTLTTLVSTAATADTQGSAFGLTQGAGSLGRTVGPPVMAALYVATRWGPFVAGALLLVPVLAILSRFRRGG